MYGADWCSDCIIAKEFLKAKGIKFEYIVITNNESPNYTDTDTSTRMHALTQTQTLPHACTHVQTQT